MTLLFLSIITGKVPFKEPVHSGKMTHVADAEMVPGALAPSPGPTLVSVVVILPYQHLLPEPDPRRSFHRENHEM